MFKAAIQLPLNDGGIIVLPFRKRTIFLFFCKKIIVNWKKSYFFAKKYWFRIQCTGLKLSAMILSIAP